MHRPESVLAVIGGSRWGQLIISILANMQLPFDRVIVISKMNAAQVQLKIVELAATSSIRFELMPTLSEAPANYNIQAAIVVNAAKQHFETAHSLIQRGIHVLIEKPVVQSLSEMQILIEDVSQHNVCMVPGLSYRFCSYLKNFSNEIFARGVPRSFSLEWMDSTNEVRYGQVKRHDAAINIVQDVMSHIWTILSVVFRSQQITINNCLSHDQAGNQASLSSSIDDIHGNVLLERCGAHRKRKLTVQLDTGAISLDFSIEPGMIAVDKNQFSADVDWKKTPTPLTRQLEYFFSLISTGSSSLSEDLQCCLKSVACTDKAVSLLEKMSSPRRRESIIIRG